MTHLPTDSDHAAVLVEVSKNIWIAEGECVNFYGFAYPTRSVIVRMATGQLWVWSPISLGIDLKRAVDALGEVAFLVSPNKIHHLFLSAWHEAYPNAQLCGPASTITKRTDLAFDLTLTDDVPAPWKTDFDQVWFNTSAFMDEVVFFHRASRTVILADLSENFGEPFLQDHWTWWQRPIARLWKCTEPFGRAPLEWRLSFRKTKALHAARDHVLAWDTKQVIMAHGEWQRADGRKFLENSFAWM